MEEGIRVEYQLHILRGLLNYHKRMMVGIEATGKGGVLKLHCDGYADALEEAIRCIEIVHKDELFGS